MNKVQKTIARLDRLQQRHTSVAFVAAVFKKYGEDEAGYKAALLTYYAFLSLFPLLLLLTTIADRTIGNYPHLEATVIRSVTDYFPLLGNQLAMHVHGLHKSGLALLMGILFTLYGTRGIAVAFRHTVLDMWRVPKSQRAGFPRSLFKSLSLIIVGGAGLLLASISASLTASAGHETIFRLISVVVNLLILFCLFEFLLNFSLPRHVTVRETRAGAATAAIGLVILQVAGGYILGHELKSLDALYSYFALPLGLLFWIYLQAQLLCYAIEVSAVSSMHLWPRHLTGNDAASAADAARTN